MGDLSDSEAPFEFTAPSPEAFAAAMGALGVGDNTRVVVYDTYNSAWAARVWWMLRWIGFDQAAILDGGLNAWTSKELPLSSEAASRPARSLSVSLRPELMTDQDEVRAAIDKDAISVIDALPAESYLGDWPMYGRPGHIAGATNVPGVLFHDEEGLYRSHDELDMLFDGDRNGRAITYCGGGIAAAQNAFVMTRLGFKDVAVYDNSLQEWAADPANPMETGTE
jgi:thiosulfate/3-mercaptopyruvate sulfurtransferase